MGGFQMGLERLGIAVDLVKQEPPRLVWVAANIEPEAFRLALQAVARLLDGARLKNLCRSGIDLEGDGDDKHCVPQSFQSFIAGETRRSDHIAQVPAHEKNKRMSGPAEAKFAVHWALGATLGQAER